MNTLDGRDSVGQWVTAHPRLSRLFESLKIDYCCGGNIALEDACHRRQLDVAEVLESLNEKLSSADGEERVDWSAEPASALCDHIEQTHHAYLRQELPRLTQLLDKVVSVHGAALPQLYEAQRWFGELRDELVPHMMKEERILFPAIREIERAGASTGFPFGSIEDPIRMMEHEHDQAGTALAEIRAALDDYRVPEGACNTLRATIDGLASLERDTHVHIHKENNILFPGVLSRQRSR